MNVVKVKAGKGYEIYFDYDMPLHLRYFLAIGNCWIKHFGTIQEARQYVYRRKK